MKKKNANHPLKDGGMIRCIKCGKSHILKGFEGDCTRWKDADGWEGAWKEGSEMGIKSEEFPAICPGCIRISEDTLGCLLGMKLTAYNCAYCGRVILWHVTPVEEKLLDECQDGIICGVCMYDPLEKRNTCLRCGYAGADGTGWVQRGVKKSSTCPKCRSPYWDKERKKHGKLQTFR